MTAPRFTMVVLMIADLPRSVAFYRRLGVEFPADVDRRNDVVVDMGGGHNIVWTTTFARNDPDRARRRARRSPWSSSSTRTREVDRLFAELTADGHHGRRPPFLTDFGAYMCLVDDPDGNMVLVTAG